MNDETIMRNVHNIFQSFTLSMETKLMHFSIWVSMPGKESAIALTGNVNVYGKKRISASDKALIFHVR